MHAALLHDSEAAALSSGGEVEAGALGESFGALLLLRWRLVLRQGLLNAATFFFEYLGSVVNYAAVRVGLQPQLTTPATLCDDACNPM